MSYKDESAKGKVLLGIIVAILIFGFNFIYKECKDTSSSSASIDKELARAAREHNKRAPYMISEDTRFDNMIALPGKILQFNFTAVDLVADEVDPELFENEMKTMMINQMKTSSQMGEFRKAKIIMRYSYNDMNGIHIATISIGPELYQ